LFAVFTATAVVFAPFVTPAAPAQAAPVVGFNAANIISDSLFYNGNAMSASEVQSFLNARVTRCTIGDPGRAAGSAWGNTKIASKCLRNFTVSTTSKAANEYCAAYAGVSGETSAQIIAKVGKACGISQKVLLVMLEKEQSLVQDTWPTVRQFDVAMGYACPDSGPNNSANCNSEYFGFFNQVYRAAWQLKRYKALPNNYRYKPFQSNSIQWHPNTGCGTSNVTIANYATAALYIYTPYRPNQAALNAGWGTGNSCSSYGNRNFYLFYTGWFGSTQGYTVSGDIAAYWNARGGEQSVYGYPASNSSLRSTKFPKGAWVQSFSGGVITTEMNTGKTVGIPFGRVYDNWNSIAGGVFGVLGAPVSEPTSYSANGGGALQWFQGGLMVSANAQGTAASIPYGPVYDLYNNTLGGIYGELGYPITSLLPYSGGELQSFQNGIVSRAKGKTDLVTVSKTGFFDYYNGVAGGIYGSLGFPLGNLTTDENGTKSQEFVNGFLMQSAGGQIVEVSGPTLTAYRAAAAAGIALGAPTGPERTIETNGGAVFTQFESGLIVTPRATGIPAALGGDIYAHYNSALGGFAGAYGYPSGNQRNYSANGGGVLQTFQKGLVIVSAEAKTTAGMLSDSPVFKRYNTVEGGIYGWLGYPVRDEVTAGDGTRSQRFQNGVIEVGRDGKVSVLPAATYDLYASLGGVGGSLGVQESAPRTYAANGGAWLSFFKNGLITQTQSDGTAASLRFNSPVYARYNGVEGGIYSWLGYPIAEERTVEGVRSQAFQHGTIGVDAQGKAFALPNASYAHYVSAGGTSGSLEAQASQSRKYTQNGGAWLSFFAKGLIVQDLAGGKVATLRFDSPIYTYYNTRAGGIYGTLGYPVADEVTQSGVTTQQFQNGTLMLQDGSVTLQK